MAYRYPQYLAWRRESHVRYETCRLKEGSQIPSITIADAPFYRIIQEPCRQNQFGRSQREESETRWLNAPRGIPTGPHGFLARRNLWCRHVAYRPVAGICKFASILDMIDPGSRSEPFPFVESQIQPTESKSH